MIFRPSLRGGDLGASAPEYVGGIVIVGMVVAGLAVAATGSGPTLAAKADCAVTKFFQKGDGNCSDAGAPVAGPQPLPSPGTSPGDLPQPSPSPGPPPSPPPPEPTGEPGVDDGDRRDQQRDARDDRRDDAGGRGDDDATTPSPGTTGDPNSKGLGNPVAGEHVDTPQPPPWKPGDEGPDDDYDTKEPSLGDRATEFAAEAAANAMSGIWPHASRNLLHFLANTGETLEQDVDAMLKDVPQFKQATEVTTTNFVAEAVRRAKESGATGPITFPLATPWEGFYISDSLSNDWFYALGGISYSVVGQVTVYPPDTPGGEWRYKTTTRVEIRDQYNWDKGKKTEIGPFTVTDEQLAELHKAGLAREYTAVGRSKSTTSEGTVP